jgi:hypothetical protein
MKTSIRLLFVLLVSLLLTGVSSCKKEEAVGTGTFEFSMTLPGDLSVTKSADTDNPLVSYQLMVSVEDLKGNPVITDKMIPVYSFGPGYVSGKVEIKNGEYKLSKFMVINAEGAVLFAAPLAGSPNAYLVSKPLPFNFNIFPDKVTVLNPEALAVGNQAPSEFGYLAFGVQLVKHLTSGRCAL